MHIWKKNCSATLHINNFSHYLPFLCIFFHHSTFLDYHSNLMTAKKFYIRKWQLKNIGKGNSSRIIHSKSYFFLQLKQVLVWWHPCAVTIFSGLAPQMNSSESMFYNSKNQWTCNQINILQNIPELATTLPINLKNSTKK